VEIIQNDIISWDEIKNLYPDEWVVIGNPVFDGMKVLNGVVLAHHKDKRVASIEGGERREGYKKFTITFTGQNKSNYHIGLLRTIHKTH
jgi:ribosomal protein L21